MATTGIAITGWQLGLLLGAIGILFAFYSTRQTQVEKDVLELKGKDQSIEARLISKADIVTKKTYENGQAVVNNTFDVFLERYDEKIDTINKRNSAKDKESSNQVLIITNSITAMCIQLNNLRNKVFALHDEPPGYTLNCGAITGGVKK